VSTLADALVVTGIAKTPMRRTPAPGKRTNRNPGTSAHRADGTAVMSMPRS
jgi:hypothetical protein